MLPMKRATALVSAVILGSAVSNPAAAGGGRIPMAAASAAQCRGYR